MTVALQFAQAQIFHLLGGELLFTGAQSETKAMQIEEKDLQPNTVGTPGKIHTINIAKKLKYRMEIQFRSQTWIQELGKMAVEFYLHRGWHLIVAPQDTVDEVFSNCP